MLFQSSVSRVMNTALAAIDLVPSRTSATNPAARTHRPTKRNTKRIMGTSGDRLTRAPRLYSARPPGSIAAATPVKAAADPASRFPA
jgi:hypothetical protein